MHSRLYSAPRLVACEYLEVCTFQWGQQWKITRTRGHIGCIVSTTSLLTLIASASAICLNLSFHKVQYWKRVAVSSQFTVCSLPHSSVSYRVVWLTGSMRTMWETCLPGLKCQKLISLLASETTEPCCVILWKISNTVYMQVMEICRKPEDKMGKKQIPCNDT
jgi:hypothetical protein